MVEATRVKIPSFELSVAEWMEGSWGVKQIVCSKVELIRGMALPYTATFPPLTIF